MSKLQTASVEPSNEDWILWLTHFTTPRKAAATDSVRVSFSLAVTQNNKPLYSFEDSSDYVYDVMWSPTHPALFACVDGVGHLDLWNLNNDTEVQRLSPASTGRGHFLPLEWIEILYHLAALDVSPSGSQRQCHSGGQPSSQQGPMGQLRERNRSGGLWRSSVCVRSRRGEPQADFDLYWAVITEALAVIKHQSSFPLSQSG